VRIVPPRPAEPAQRQSAAGAAIVDVLRACASGPDDRTSRDAVLQLARIAAHKDGDTAVHIDRVGFLSSHLAGACGMPSWYVEQMRWAAPMHDIGKLCIPDAVLRKPGPLDADETATMRRHPELGAAMLSGTSVPVLELAAEIALRHHEKYDGSGYPDGLAGNAIPLSARIVALADYYDALSMPRVYRAAWPAERIRESIRGLSGRHFDPALVDVFLARLDQFAEIRRVIDRSTGAEPVPALTPAACEAGWTR
jgi:putative two-component system response regulator